MYLQTKWVCSEKEFFCHLLLVFIISIYIGISLGGGDNSEAILLKKSINMLDRSILETNLKLKQSDTTLTETEKKYQNYNMPYDSRCVNLNTEFLKSHGF